MKRIAAYSLIAWVLVVAPALIASASTADTERDILITFDNSGARASPTAGAAPYRFRKRYEVTSAVRRVSAAVAKEHKLVAIDHWPIRSLSVYCFVYRVPDGIDRELVIAHLSDDPRVESVQLLQKFETHTNDVSEYNDPYARMQHGLQLLALKSAHEHSTGLGVRIAIIDSHADTEHEDLKGRIRRIEVFSGNNVPADSQHGTAVASVIGARSNNALGIVGVAPQATLDVLVSCWHDDGGVVCDSFSLAKALDRMLEDPPEVLNLSLTGPEDGLVRRLLRKAIAAGVVVVASQPSGQASVNSFPASMDGVIGVATSVDEGGSAILERDARLFAPGDQIMVAVPDNQYDFRSGSSLAAAHVSGVIALILSVSPDETTQTLKDILRQSQVDSGTAPSVNAHAAIQLAHSVSSRAASR